MHAEENKQLQYCYLNGIDISKIQSVFGQTCMCSLVYLQVFRPREDLPAARERAGERFLSRVHPNVVHQFVFRFEWLVLPAAVLPEADVVGLLRATDVFHGDVRD